MKYQPIIGLEVHLQPKTKSKMFCSCSAEYFGGEPNTHTCPVCLGLPGALPVPNRAAIEKCIKLGLALNCTINKESKFDRKNYFYPDLPKGYQISQYDQPIAENGFVEADVNGDSKRFRITRVHAEEDTGKSTHQGDKTLLDFNKSGMPLLEIVTEPDFTSADEVDAFAKRLRQTIRYCDISDADMEKGQMRYELNISLQSEPGELPDYKIEVKNIGSISVLKKVIDFEIKRQSEILDRGETPTQETRGLKDMSGETLSQRTKEGSADYRYFPEPDIPKMVFDDELIESLRAEIPELPQEKKLRYIKDYEIDPSTAEVLVGSKALREFFEEMVKIDSEKLVEATKWLVGDLRRLTKANNIKLKDSKVTPQHLVDLVTLLEEGKIKSAIAKEVLTKVFESGKSPSEIVEENQMEVIEDSSELEGIVQKVIDANPKIVGDYQRNPNAAQFLLGQVMKETHGQADPLVVKDLLEKLLDS
ncbi:Asp-tRNA(Asn)/Glu-tRNA(Gln) amidotransferase subunit GatB [Candidatus Dojkabacteria bacterium]|nr:Asp-tRNA(Asn)/Glu-tRNA(Gln) amidotransferase subunit GatB [Candidatus Dojkabacteria bacterium]